jgi:hypothetical protein
MEGVFPSFKRTERPLPEQGMGPFVFFDAAVFLTPIVVIETDEGGAL